MARPTKAHPPDAQVTVGLRMSGKLKSDLEAASRTERYRQNVSAGCGGVRPAPALLGRD